MPLLIAGTPYALPTDPGQKGLTGEELDGIESHFGIDALLLLQVLGAPDDSPRMPGYTRNRALFSVVWIALNRGGVKVSLADVMRDYAVSDFDFEEPAENPTQAAPQGADQATDDEAQIAIEM